MYKVVYFDGDDTRYSIGDIIHCIATRGTKGNEYTLDYIFMIVTVDYNRGGLVVLRDNKAIPVGRLGEMWNYSSFDLDIGQTVSKYHLEQYLGSTTLRIYKVSEIHLT